MSRRTRALVFMISTPLVAIVAIGGLLGAGRATAQQALPHLSVFNDVLRLIISDYVEPPNVDKVMDGAMRGLVDGLDPDTSYLSPDEVRSIDAHAAPADGDVGLVISRQFYLRIVGVRDGSPAARAGLQSGDFIRAINDTPTRDMSSFTGARLLRGAPGSKVTLLIIRNGNTADPRPIDLVRAVAPADRAAGRRLPGGEAYVRVTSFGAGAADAIRAAVAATGSAASAGVIVDLRDVADGTPDEGVAAARLFIKSGTIAIRAGRPVAAASPTPNASAADPDALPRADAPPPPIPANAVRVEAGPGDGALAVPVVLLTSNGTAYGAEVFAAALAENHRATIVGEVTAGLAGVQRLIRLPDGYGLLMTTERYLQNDGYSIHNRGVRPTVPLDIPTIAFDDTKPAGDPLLDRAIKELKSPTPAPSPTAAATPATPGQTTRPQPQ